MYIFYSIHFPQPEKAEIGAAKMRQFDELIKQQPGIIFASDIFKDPQRDTLIGMTFWESQADWAAAWPSLVKAVPTGEWERQPPEVYMFNSAD